MITGQVVKQWVRVQLRVRWDVVLYRSLRWSLQTVTTVVLVCLVAAASMLLYSRGYSDSSINLWGAAGMGVGIFIACVTLQACVQLLSDAFFVEMTDEEKAEEAKNRAERKAKRARVKFLLSQPLHSDETLELKSTKHLQVAGVILFTVWLLALLGGIVFWGQRQAFTQAIIHVGVFYALFVPIMIFVAYGQQRHKRLIERLEQRIGATPA